MPLQPTKQVLLHVANVQCHASLLKCSHAFGHPEDQVTILLLLRPIGLTAGAKRSAITGGVPSTVHITRISGLLRRPGDSLAWLGQYAGECSNFDPTPPGWGQRWKKGSMPLPCNIPDGIPCSAVQCSTGVHAGMWCVAQGCLCRQVD